MSSRSSFRWRFVRQWFQPVSPLLIGDRYGDGFLEHKSVSDPVPGSVSGRLDAAPTLDRWKLNPEIEGRKPDNCRSSFRNRITIEPADLKQFPFAQAFEREKPLAGVWKDDSASRSCLGCWVSQYMSWVMAKMSMTFGLRSR